MFELYMKKTNNPPPPLFPKETINWIELFFFISKLLHCIKGKTQDNSAFLLSNKIQYLIFTLKIAQQTKIRSRDIT